LKILLLLFLLKGLFTYILFISAIFVHNQKIDKIFFIRTSKFFFIRIVKCIQFIAVNIEYGNHIIIF